MMNPEHRKNFESLTDAQLLGILIYGEARSENMDGRIAVGSTVLNRSDFGKKRKRWGKIYGNSVKAVVLAPRQYSCFNESDRNYPELLAIAQSFNENYYRNIVLRGCLDIAQGLLSGQIKRNVKALHYNTVASDPKWDDEMKLEAKIGNHEFFV